MTFVEADGPRRAEHLGELSLRRLRAGELSDEQVVAADEHIAACALCRTKLRGLAEEQRAFEREIPFERFAGGVERARRVPRPRPRSLWGLGLGGALAAAAVAIFLMRAPAPSRNAVKGTSVEATIRIATANGSRQRVAPPGSHEVLESGDRVRLGYTLAEARYLAALSVDEQGEVTPLYPESGHALAVAASAETVYLPDSVEFTGRGREKVFLFLARRPFDVQAARQAITAGYRASHGDLDTLPNPAFAGGQQVFSWLFKKP